jgi:hypothetical protein
MMKSKRYISKRKTAARFIFLSDQEKLKDCGPFSVGFDIL